MAKTKAVTGTIAKLQVLSVLVGCLFLAHGALAQQSGLNKQALVYMAYPIPSSRVEPFKLDNFPKWATLDMQIRERGENQSSDGYVSGNDAVYDLSRIWGALEVRPTQHFLAYIQFMDLHALGLPLKYVSANMRDDFDDRQAFLEYHAKNVKIIAGRQELRYGEERLVGISNWTNNSRTWDGFLGRIGDKNRLDLFSTSVVAVHAESLDKHGAGLTFHGAVGTITTWVPHTVLMPFVYVKALPRVESQQSTYGTETEVTPGAEVSGKYQDGFYFETLGALQRGSYANDSIQAGAGYAKVGYTAEKINWKPRLTGEYKYASGNPNKTSSSTRIGTFDQQYPSNHNAFGMTDLFGYQNIKMDRIHLDMAPLKRMSLLIEQEWMQVATVHDSVYSGSASATVKAPTAGFLSDDIGREFDASGQYAFLRDDLTLNFGIARFSPGALMIENAHGADLTEGHFGLTYKFNVNGKDSAH
ncbi:MAG: alginate export family protein [Terracidiphilus sp.]